MRDPVILVDYVNDLIYPIATCNKPLPALLAPPSSTHLGGSLSSFASSISLQADDHHQEIQELKQDLVKLNDKYINQIHRTQLAEQAQFQVESELEDLSSRLFEQANEMVAQEKKARFLAEKKVAQLEKELSSVYEALDDEREQLKELRAKLTDNSELLHPLSTPKEESPLYAPNLHLDDGWLGLFKEFLTVAPDTPLESIHRLPFMKQCLELDIAPCLRFGNKGKLSMKKVLEAVIKQPCFIESDKKRYSHDDRMTAAPPMVVARRSSFAMLRSAIMASAKSETTYACHGCGNTSTSTTHLFRFKLKETDVEWFWIDRSCRDRLVAVCNFYVFIRHVRQGLQSQKTIKSLFQECVWLRLVMFWARSGVHHSI